LVVRGRGFRSGRGGVQAQRLDQRLHILHRKMEGAHSESIAHYNRALDLSWIYHDSALEGVVYSMDELKAALENQPAPETALVPVFDEIRQNKAALDLVRELA